MGLKVGPYSRAKVFVILAILLLKLLLSLLIILALLMLQAIASAMLLPIKIEIVQIIPALKILLPRKAALQQLRCCWAPAATLQQGLKGPGAHSSRYKC